MGKFAGNLRYHVLLVGSLANNDLILANSLTGLGVRCVVSFTSNFTYAMHWCLALWRLLPFPPVINYTTGSDIMELAVAPSLHGFVYRWFLKRGALTVLVPIPAYRESIRRLKLRNYLVHRYAFLSLKETATNCVDRSGPIVYLHPSHLDWGETDNKPGRKSTKGNDCFLRAATPERRILTH